MSTGHKLFDADKLPHGTHTKRALADARGFKVYDTTLPQQWLDRVVHGAATKQKELDHNELYRHLLFGTVWEYDTHTLGGPGFLTLQAYAIYELFFAAEGGVDDIVQG